MTATFAKDCCDREIMAFRAWEGKGLPGEPVREMLIEAGEKRFGAVEAMPAGHLLQFLSDNGSAYIAHETRRIAECCKPPRRLCWCCTCHLRHPSSRAEVDVGPKARAGQYSCDSSKGRKWVC